VVAHLAATGGAAPDAPARVAGPVVIQSAHGAGAERDGGFWHGRLQTWKAAVETAADRPLAGAGADAFLAASARHQRAGPVRFAHDLPLELAAELGVAGLLLGVALYVTAGAAVWRARASRAAWLLGPAVLAFLAAGLVDWPWHLAGSGAVWAASLGALVGAASAPAASVPGP
jgi:O-antigen ligase